MEEGKIMRFTNLFVGYNQTEDFRILICAFDEDEAAELAREYCCDSKFRGSFEIKKAEGKIDDIHFDCDYVIS